MSFKPFAAALMAFVSINSFAAPVSGQGTWEQNLLARDLDADGIADAFYDQAQGITWLANAGIGGTRTWADATAFVAGLVVGSYDGWRLPSMTYAGDLGASCVTTYSSGACGYNVDTSTSEMAHLYYVSLGNRAYWDTNGVGQSGYGLTNTGDFQDMQSWDYWLGTPFQTSAWFFGTRYGLQQTMGQTTQNFTMAVHEGDVGVAVTPVPEPSTYALMLAGLAAVTFAAKRRRVKDARPAA